MIVPAWNASRSIGTALRSVLDDPGLRVECIVVDDGSQDGTAAIAEEIAMGDPRIVVIRSGRNEGVSSARNRGLEVSRGEWLTFLDADDRFLANGAAVLMEAAIRANALAVVGQRIWSDGSTTWISDAYDIADIREPGRKSIVTNPGLMYYASATGKVFHRSIIGELWFEGRVLGDQPWTIRALIRAGDRIEVIGETVYEWSRPRPDNPFPSITAAKYASAHRAAEAARVAIRAFADVRAEADAVIPNPADAALVAAAYFERLVRSDLSGPVRRAVATRDDGTVELFEAIEAFLAACPPKIVRESPSVPSRILHPPVDRWLRIPPAGRNAYWRLFRTAVRIDPGMPARLGRPGLVRLGLAVVARRDGPVARALASGCFAAHWPIGIVERLTRRARRRALASRGPNHR